VSDGDVCQTEMTDDKAVIDALRSLPADLDGRAVGGRPCFLRPCRRSDTPSEAGVGDRHGVFSEMPGLRSTRGAANGSPDSAKRHDFSPQSEPGQTASAGQHAVDRERVRVRVWK